MHNTLLPRLVLPFVFFTICLSVVRAQDSEQALLTRAQQATAAGQWGEVVTIIESLRRQYPQGIFLPDGLVLLYRAHVHQQDSEKAAVIGKEIVARWPKSNFVWQVVLITCKKKAETSPDEAIASLELALKQQMLSEADRLTAQKFRLTYLQQAKGEQFMTEALAQVNALKLPIKPNELMLAIEAARQAYLPLMRSGRYDEARAMSAKLQGLLVHADKPAEKILADQRAYFLALKAADMKRYISEAVPAVHLAKLADTPAELALPLELAGFLYLELLRARRDDDALALYTVVQTAGKRLEITRAQLRGDTISWLNALYSFRQEQLATEMRKVIAAMKTATEADDIAFRVIYTTPVYTDCFKQRQPEVAQELHAQVQTYLHTFHLTSEASVDRAQYTCEALLYQKSVAFQPYLAEAPIRLLEIVERATEVSALGCVSRVTAWGGLYQDLFKAGRTADATNLYERLQTAVTRIDPKNAYLLNANQRAYLTTFGRCDPEAFAPVFLPLLEAAITRGAPDDIKLCSEIAQSVYGPLLETGQVAAAQRIHTQLQTVLQRMPAFSALAQTETQSYFTALSNAAPEAFLAEIKTVLSELAKAQTLEAAQRYAPIVQTAYAPLNQSGAYLEARTAHEQLQALFAKFNRTADAEADTKKYTASISVQALEAILQLFKKAIVANDTAAAKKWLDEMNAIAPESPQATRARGIWKEAGNK